jgi:hypothetical protein
VIDDPFGLAAEQRPDETCSTAAAENDQDVAQVIRHINDDFVGKTLFDEPLRRHAFLPQVIHRAIHNGLRLCLPLLGVNRHLDG